MDWEDALESELQEALEDPQSEKWMQRQRDSVAPESIDVAEQLARHARMLQYMVDKLEVDPNMLVVAGQIEKVVKQLKVAIRAAEEADYESR